MSTPKSAAVAVCAVRHIEAAWETWSGQEPRESAPQDEQDAWQAGYEAFGSAHEAASAAVREMPSDNLADATCKLSFLVGEMEEVTEPWRWAALNRVATELAALCQRPTQDAFAVKLRAYQRATRDRDAFVATQRPAAGEGLTAEWRTFEAVMSPLHTAVFDSGKAVLLEPAPDLAALLAKRAIFDALQFQDDDEAPEVTHRLFDDAMAFAGGAA